MVSAFQTFGDLTVRFPEGLPTVGLSVGDGTDSWRGLRLPLLLALRGHDTVVSLGCL